MRKASGKARARWISRADWGATEARQGAVPQNPERIIIHHTATPRASDYAGHETVLEIQRFHQNDRGWDDTAYHFVIAPDGAVYEGRPPRVEGAHVKNHNQGSIGVALIGNFESGEDKIPTAAWRSLVKLVELLCERFEIPRRSIHGHRDFNAATACPGDCLYSRLPDLRKAGGR
ncbi:MAG: peptidoglycan recognition protein family protein [bacterium]